MDVAVKTILNKKKVSHGSQTPMLLYFMSSTRSNLDAPVVIFRNAEVMLAPDM